MVESRYVLYGLIAGAISGIIAGITSFLTMPTLDEVLEYVKSYTGIHGITEDVLRGYLTIALILSPFIAFIFSLILGAIFGAVYEYFDKKIPGPTILSALLTGLVYAAILILPNIALAASQQKILVNTLCVISYTVVLITLTIHKSPRISSEERYNEIEG